MEPVLFSLTIVLVLAMIAAATWLVGLWNNIITWITLVISAMVASSFFEPLATRLNEKLAESSYLVDFVAVWGLFIATYAVLRILTEVLSKYRLQFDVWTETIGRTVMSILIALTFFAFASFTLHMAPMPVDGPWGQHFQATPDAQSFGIGADRSWMNFVRSESMGAFSERIDSPILFPYELPTTTGVREFDPAGELMSRYHQRRRNLAAMDNIQIMESKK